MEKFRAILKDRQGQFDDPESRETINRLIIQKAIDHKVRNIGRQELFLRILVNLTIFTVLATVFCGLKDPSRKIYIEEIQVGTWVIVVGTGVLLNTIQKVMQVLRVGR